MYINLKIEWGERLVPSLEKARQIAELLGVDVMTEIDGEKLRVPHDLSFDAESELAKHRDYCERAIGLNPINTKRNEE